MSDRAQIHNIEAEQALLGAIFINNDAFRNVAHMLEPADFFDPLHGSIWQATADLINSGSQANPVLLRSMFEGKDADGFSAWEYLVKLASSATTIIGAPSYARTILDLSRRRALISQAGEFIEGVGSPATPLSQTCGEFITTLDEALSGRESGESRSSLWTAADDAIATLDATEAHEGITTGLVDLDHVLGGYYPGEFVIIASRPGMGKSTFSPSTLLRTASKGHGVLYFSLEMTKGALAQRCLTDLAWNSTNPIPYISLRRKSVGDHDIGRLRESLGKLKSLPFNIDDKPGLTVAEISARARAMAQKFQREGRKLSVVCIDHMGKIRATGRYAGNKVNEVGEISNALAGLAKDLGCSVIALSQLSRAVESQDRKNKRPVLSDLRNSGDIEQDADVVMFLYRPEYYLEQMKIEGDDEKAREAERKRVAKLEASRGLMEIIVAKQRSGPIRTVKAFCDMGSNVVRDRI